MSKQTNEELNKFYEDNCERAVVNFRIFKMRCSKGMEAEQALTQLPKDQRTAQNSFVGGEREKYKRIAIENGKTSDLYNGLIKHHGMSYKEAAYCDYKIPVATEEQYIVAENNGIKRPALRGRLRNGWKLEDAVGLGVWSKTVENEKYYGVEDEAKKISDKRMEKRIRKQIMFYSQNGLVIPKKYHWYIKAHQEDYQHIINYV